MIGAIIGDIVGSRFEFNNHKSKDFLFFAPECCFTDDSVMSLAVAEAILNSCGNWEMLSLKTIKSMQRLGKLYPYAGYGSLFSRWLQLSEPNPYNSLGNGSAMRVSACGFAASTLEEAKHLSYNVTCITHNHYEGIKGAEATAVAIFLARNGCSMEEIREEITARYYPIDFSLDSIRPEYSFTEICQDTVPQAFAAFFESESFEDAIRNAISIGGDSDTLGAIAGGIAEAYYGVPQNLREDAMAYLPLELSSILNQFEEEYQ